MIQCAEKRIDEVADKQGESHAAIFLREHNKIFICDSEAETIELPSYHAKRCLHLQYCRNKG